MGPHLLPAALWEQATDAVLLASFAAFVPPGREGRATQAALRAMDARLEAGEATALLREFFREAAAPQPPGALPARTAGAGHRQSRGCSDCAKT